jgi:hypothetical protein
VPDLATVGVEHGANRDRQRQGCQDERKRFHGLQAAFVGHKATHKQCVTTSKHWYRCLIFGDAGSTLVIPRAPVSQRRSNRAWFSHSI